MGKVRLRETRASMQTRVDPRGPFHFQVILWLAPKLKMDSQATTTFIYLKDKETSSEICYPLVQFQIFQTIRVRVWSQELSVHVNHVGGRGQTT